MSIPNILDKIKSKISIDKSTIMYLFIIVGVGISSFGLGRMSVINARTQYKDSESFLKTTYLQKDTSENTLSPEIIKEKVFVASKNGKMYYTVGCSGAKRIKQENQVWFSSKTDAEKAGYTLSTTCK